MQSNQLWVGELNCNKRADDNLYLWQLTKDAIAEITRFFSGRVRMISGKLLHCQSCQTMLPPKPRGDNVGKLQVGSKFFLGRSSWMKRQPLLCR